MDEDTGQEQLQRLSALDRMRSGSLSRRDFLRGSLTIGMGLAGGSLLTGSADEADQLQAKQRRFLAGVSRSYAGATVRVVSEAHGLSAALNQLVQSEFVPLTGIAVDWRQQSLPHVLDSLLAHAEEQSVALDILHIDQAWLGTLARHTVDPHSLLTLDNLAYPGYNFADFVPQLVQQLATYRGRLVGVPYDIPLFIMLYRQDVLEELGLAVPRSLQEYHAVVKAIHTARAPDVYGTVGQWQAGHYALSCDMTAWLWAHGGSIFGADGQSTVNDARAHAAMTYMLELGQYMPPDVTAWDWWDVAHSWMQGQVGIGLFWSDFFPALNDPQLSPMAGRIKAAPCPRPSSLRSASACGWGETPGISHQGGSCLAVSRYSQQPEAAWIFLQWATSPDVLLRASLLSKGTTPVRISSFRAGAALAHDLGLGSATEHWPVCYDAITKHMGTEPRLPLWSDLAVDGFAYELGRMVNHEQSISVTLEQMAVAAQQSVERSRSLGLS